MTEAWSGQILIDHFRLGLLPLRCLTSTSDFDEGMAEGVRQGKHRLWMGDPHILNHPECFNFFGKRLTHNDGDLRFGSALIFPELRKPTITPILGAF
jgi:hypothetical protein